MSDVISTLVGEELEGGDTKWKGTLAAPNGYLYGIPLSARRVVKFNPVDYSMTFIGPDFGDGWFKWYNGAINDSGIIYCVPCNSRRGILKIDTNTDNVTELDANLLPEQGDHMWVSCAVAVDGCIYFMPRAARQIMKLDPNNNDAMSSVGDNFGYSRYKYTGTVIGIDGCVYGMPYNAKRILKYDPINDTTSFVGEKADSNRNFECNGNGGLGRDGYIYALTNHGRVLKIDTVNNSHRFVVDNSAIDTSETGDAILGIDGCIYWAPCYNGYTLKYDPHSKQFSRVGDNFETEVDETELYNWFSGALANDGVVYCIPSNANRVLAIDPIGEFLATTKTVIQDHPKEFGYLFQTIEAEVTNFDLAVVKFGQNVVFDALEKSMKPVNDYCKESNLCPFMIAASYKESPVCVINHLLRRDLSWMNSCTISSLECNAPKNKKVRIK